MNIIDKFFIMRFCKSLRDRDRDTLPTRDIHLRHTAWLNFIFYSWNTNSGLWEEPNNGDLVLCFTWTIWPI